jgi:hypothetical protein
MRREALNANTAKNVADIALNSPFQSVAPAEYCELAVSSRPLIRWDDASQGLKGLRDTVTGEFFVVDASRLLSHNVTHA